MINLRVISSLSSYISDSSVRFDKEPKKANYRRMVVGFCALKSALENSDAFAHLV